MTADSMTISYCEQCEQFHLRLYRRGYQEPYAECSFSEDMLTAMLDGDVQDASVRYHDETRLLS